MKRVMERFVFRTRNIVTRTALTIVLLTISTSSHCGESRTDLGLGLYLGSAVAAENLTIWPVYTTNPIQKVKGEFITLADAQQKKTAVIHEKGKGNQQTSSRRNNRRQPNAQMASESAGVVGELVIQNTGDKPILVLAGTLLKGGKQDRQVGQDFVVPANKTVEIGAFCVEHGRWSAHREGKSTGGVFQAQKSLATKDVRKSAQYKGDQGEVWAKVAEVNKKAGKAPGSGTLFATIEDKDKKSKARRARISKVVFDQFTSFSKDKVKPIGLAYAVDGKIKEVRSFTHPRIFERFTETLVNTAVMEADLAQREAKIKKRPVYRKKASAKQVAKLVKNTSKVKAEKRKTKAGNFNRTRKAGKMMNADCFESELDEAPITSSFMNED